MDEHIHIFFRPAGVPRLRSTVIFQVKRALAGVLLITELCPSAPDLPTTLIPTDICTPIFYNEPLPANEIQRGWHKSQHTTSLAYHIAGDYPAYPTDEYGSPILVHDIHRHIQKETWFDPAKDAIEDWIWAQLDQDTCDHYPKSSDITEPSSKWTNFPPSKCLSDSKTIPGITATYSDEAHYWLSLYKEYLVSALTYLSFFYKDYVVMLFAAMHPLIGLLWGAWEDVKDILLSFGIPTSIRPAVRQGMTRLEWKCSCGENCYGDYIADDAESVQQLLAELASMALEAPPEEQSLYNFRDWGPQIDPFIAVVARRIMRRLLRKPLQALRVYLHVVDDALPMYLMEVLGYHVCHYFSKKLRMLVMMTAVSMGFRRVSGGTQQENTVKASTSVGEAQYARKGREAVRSTPHASTPQSVPVPESSRDGEYGINSPNFSEPRFFELCVNINSVTIALGEINLASSKSCVETDGQLFEHINNRYHALRKQYRLRWLYKPVNIHFVRFNLYKISYVGIFDSPLSIPSSKEVEEGRYHYHECPLDPLPPIDHRTFFHYFGNQDRHAHSQSKVFINRLPKKLNTTMREQYRPDQLNVGWGVHIIEGLNKTALSFCFLLLLTSSLLVSLIYAVVKRDVQGTFAIGQWMVAVLAAGLTAAYYHLSS